ncbi:MAG: type VI secretion system tip protein VgrG [Rhodobacteraceae bacterium]|nr:type VI secretion system tip protein VgrG [Paracoccaceae bacterium]
MPSNASIGAAEVNDLQLKRAIVEESMSTLSRARVEFYSDDTPVDLTKLVGKPFSIEMDVTDTEKRKFMGSVVEAEFLGYEEDAGLYRVEVRPWLWFLTRTRDCRVFQDVSTVDVVMSILGDLGFSAHVTRKLSKSYSVRPFCLQYRETDFDFISRLMEEDGIYYFFDNTGGTEKLVLADGRGSHSPMPVASTFEVDAMGGANSVFRNELIFGLSAKKRVTTGKVTLKDYDFEAPKKDLTVLRTIAKGTHSRTDYEAYDYPGRYRANPVGETYARVGMEAEASRYETWTGAGTVGNITVGHTVTITGEDHTGGVTKFLVTEATHYLQANPGSTERESGPGQLGEPLQFDPDNKDHYRCVFDVVPESEPYQPARVTAWPEIPGIQTAVVVGPKGEEIYTDKYGRVKIQFHWDREGKNDEKSSVWVRAMSPWGGKNWGMVAVPRIGQEVVVQFEEGNPDRPVVIGMLYNADNMPPYGLPANMTQSGVKTNSSKGGGGFNELMFEDKKGDELVRFQSEKDYRQIVKNNAEITIGLEKKDKGDLVQTIHRHKTETLKTGDMTFTVQDGNEARTIAKNQTQDIGKNQTENIGESRTQTIGKNSSVTIGQNSDIAVGKNMDLKVSSNLKETVGQNIEITAGMKILLKVAGSSIEISPKGIEMKGPMITIQANAMLEAKAPMTQVKGDTLLILKGMMTLIN